MQTNKSTTKSLSILEKSELINILIPDDVQKKIKTLCSYIHYVEWSGILLYSVEGSIKDPANMIIHLKDIILMNKGTATFTDYAFNEKKRDTEEFEDRHIDYVMEHPGSEYWKIGLIHSHNTMDVFFSGTDMEEIIDNSSGHNFYLSLICNNRNEYVAKMAVRSYCKEEISCSFNAIDENGAKFITETKTIPIIQDIVSLYKCNIQLNNVEIQDNFFEKTLKDILKNGDKRKVEIPVYQNFDAAVKKVAVEKEKSPIVETIAETILKSAVLNGNTIKKEYSFLQCIETIQKNKKYNRESFLWSFNSMLPKVVESKCPNDQDLLKLYADMLTIVESYTKNPIFMDLKEIILENLDKLIEQ